MQEERKPLSRACNSLLEPWGAAGPGGRRGMPHATRTTRLGMTAPRGAGTRNHSQVQAFRHLRSKAQD